MSASTGAASAVTRYAIAITRGRIVAGEYVRLACERHLRDLRRSRTSAFPFRFDARLAATNVKFFALLRHTKGEWAGRPVELEPWEQFIIGSDFGWLHKKTGLRRFRTSYTEVAKKNGKSTLAAGASLKLAFFDGEAGAEVYCAATKKDQAKIVWGEARAMVLANPNLKKRISVLATNLSVEKTRSKLEPLGRDSDTLDGINPNGYILDELHRHKDRRVVDVLETATAARRQPLGFMITTAGSDRASVCWEFHDYATKILRGLVVDETFFAYIAALDKGDRWDDPKAWPKANPNYGISVKPDDLKRKAEKARENPMALNAFLRFHGNLWTQAHTRLLDPDKWRACAPRRPIEELLGKRCWGGLDLSSTDDLAAFVLVFPDEIVVPARGDEPEESLLFYDVLTWLWCPAESVKRRSQRDLVSYDAWVRDGYISAPAGAVLDYGFIEAEIKKQSERFEISRIGFDPWNASYVVTRLMDHFGDDGSEDDVMVKVGQSFANLTTPTKEMMRSVAQGTLRHGGHPVLAWMADNVEGRMDPQNNVKIDKGRSREKIDGIAALVMALGRATLERSQPPPKKSVYARRGGFLVI